MTGGLIQLINTGEQDNYIINKPEITFFKTVYRRHTNFSVETKEEEFSGATGFGKRTECILKKQGDLLSKLCLKIDLPSLNMAKPTAKKDICIKDLNCECCCIKCSGITEDTVFSWVNSIGHVIVKYVEIMIGGKTVDTHYGEWLEVWYELTQTTEKRAAYSEMVGKVHPGSFNPSTFTDEMTLLVPLNFWFCRNVGLALPLLALEKHDITLAVKWRDFDDCWIANKPDVRPMLPSFHATVYADYVYLDLVERMKFATESHMYLIEQVQFTGDCFFDKRDGVAIVDIDKFRHPCKEFIWTVQRTDTLFRSIDESDPDFTYGNDWFNFTSFKSRKNCKIKDSFDKAHIQFSGFDRIKPLSSVYYRLLQPYYHHTGSPRNYIYSYSFALKPEEHQPTGTCNMSTLQDCRLVLKMNKNRESDYIVKVYTINYNLFIVTGGMGGLGFKL